MHFKGFKSVLQGNQSDGIGGCYLGMKMFMKMRAWFSLVRRVEMSCDGGRVESNLLAGVVLDRHSSVQLLNQSQVVCVPHRILPAATCRKLTALHLND